MNFEISQKSISIFIPVYNEEKNIDYTILSILEVLKRIADDYEILVIDDGSTDGSKEKVLRWMKKSNRVRLIGHRINLGYGLSLRDGFKNAKKDLILYTDADMPMDINEIKKVLPLMDIYDLVIGYRIDRKDKPRRFIYSKIYNFLLRLLLNVKVRDANFSFKCIKKEVLQRCNLNARSVFIDGELLAEVVRNNFTIKEIPLIYIPRKHGASNFDSLNSAISTMKELMFYWLNKYSSGKKS